ncbi:MAG: hypothetical protein K9L78_02780 [Victivallales bacterium]|nr:hypothetical protein [Victivallales bacterium]MCF7889021.1 hypothetical protein [Victivallales bacterium]
MGTELSYVIITPYTIQKSRTGGVLARLLSRTDLDFVGAKMLAPTKDFISEYTEVLEKDALDDEKDSVKNIADYIKESFVPHENKYHRVMFLLFKGENACEKIYKIAGKIKPGIRTGETIRDTYSDCILTPDGSVRYFEPAIIVPSSKDNVQKELKCILKYIERQPNIINKDLLTGDNNRKERTLVIIKPDNWHHPSSRPGSIVDMLSKTGLRIVGCKLYRMSIEEALEFYGPVQEVLRKKLAPEIGEQAKKILEREFEFKISDKTCESLTETVGEEFADDQFSMIVEFMSGIRPEECPREEYSAPGRAKCLVLIYQGKDAVQKIRSVLGPTDPTKAPGGTIRRDFGTDVMINTAHASDSYENAKREMKIVKIEKNDISEIIQSNI